MVSQRTRYLSLIYELPVSASPSDVPEFVMRRFLNVLFILSLGAAGTATLLKPDHVATHDQVSVR